MRINFKQELDRTLDATVDEGNLLITETVNKQVDVVWIKPHELEAIVKYFYNEIGD
ncbi:MAG TPA: hypothetical protein VGF75_00400 [Candidatus Saccharimonadales bacterium]|jgi:hypothetical protein